MFPSHEFPGNYVYYVSFIVAVAFFLYSAGVKVSIFARGKGE